MDALTKAFVLCYDERPENPIERLVEVVADNARVLGASSELKSRLMNTELELKQARSEIDLLRKQLTDLGVTPVSLPSLTGRSSENVATGNGPTIATLSAEAEKTVPSSNTSVVEASNAVNTGAIPKTPKSTAAASTQASTTPENTVSVSESATQADTNTNDNTTGAKTAEETTGTATTTTTTSAATNTEDSATKEAAT